MSKKRIFKRALAIKLVERGHRLIKIEENKYNPDYMVYIFEQTFRFQEDMFQINNR